MRCRIRVRSGDLISAVDGVTCDDEASVAKKTRPGNQSLGVTVLMCLKGQESAINNIAFARRTAIHFTSGDCQPGNHQRDIEDGFKHGAFPCSNRSSTP